MIRFSKDKVLLLHQILAEATGGSVGVRDDALLDSALESAFAGFGDREFYPSKEEKGARLGFALISNHAFVDGNKRIGIYVMMSFLEMTAFGFVVRMMKLYPLACPLQMAAWDMKNFFSGSSTIEHSIIRTRGGCGFFVK